MNSKTKIKLPTGNTFDGDASESIVADGGGVTGEVMDPHPEPGSVDRYFRVLEEAMSTCMDIAAEYRSSDPKLAVGASLAAGRLAQTGHKMVLDEERAEREREDHDDKHLRLAGRTASPHARVRQARAERRLIRREENEISKNKPKW